MKIYRMLIAKPAAEKAGDTSTRTTYNSPRQGKAPNGYVCLAVIGYYEQPKEKYKEANEELNFMPTNVYFMK